MGMRRFGRARGNADEHAGSRRYLSFFSGALGLDLGLERAGYQCLAVNEIDAIACETIRGNLRHASSRSIPRIYPQDIRELTSEKLISDLQLAPGELFAIVGALPCQAFLPRESGLALTTSAAMFFFTTLIYPANPAQVRHI